MEMQSRPKSPNLESQTPIPQAGSQVPKSKTQVSPARGKSQSTGSGPAGGEGAKLVSAFSVCYGIFFGICLLKFGNPPIMERWVTAPKDLFELVFGYPWPISWAYTGLAALGIFGLVAGRWSKTSGSWLIWVLLAWWVWQVVAAARSVDDSLSTSTLKHLTANVVCFVLGFFALSRSKNLWPFWAGIFSALLLVIWSGWGQPFGGLEETREYFMKNVYPTLREVPLEYLKKLSSGRIFATFFYPNALAGGILLLLPPTLALLWHTERFTRPARLFLMAAIAGGCFACLFWSGSKGGWLLMLVLGVLAVLRLSLQPKYKAAIIVAVLVVGCAGFLARHLIFFQKGATSVSARFDYWQAAVRIARQHPITGTGPGTFFIPYQAIKKPESEPSRLVHNDYLEQASDSGFPGLVLYSVFAFGSILTVIRRKDFRTDWVVFCVGLGVLGFFLQEFMEFSMYIPSLAWLTFALLGWLVGREHWDS